VEDGKRHEFDHRMIAADGRVVWFHTSINITSGPYVQRELTGVMTEITARKRLERANRELSASVLRLRDEERRRISIELHDSLGQYLTALKINLAMLSREDASPARQRTMLADTMELADSCIQEVRNYSYLLHPPTLDLLGLPSALEWYADGVSKRSGIRIELDIAKCEKRLPRKLELPFFRIAEEALTNIVRHSRSKTATVLFRQYSEQLVLEIADQGVGIPARVTKSAGTGGKNGRKGFGLLGMRERMRELGGRLEIQSSPSGTLIRASAPCPSDASSPLQAPEGERPSLRTESSLKAGGRERSSLMKAAGLDPDWSW
jgi:two-component system NarL family sensor kinase